MGGKARSTPELQRVFEPYFTGRVQGHGLGLAAVLGIVKANSGALRVRCEPGAGSRFECYFLVIDDNSAIVNSKMTQRRGSFESPGRWPTLTRC